MGLRSNSYTSSVVMANASVLLYLSMLLRAPLASESFNRHPIACIAALLFDPILPYQLEDNLFSREDSSNWHILSRPPLGVQRSSNAANRRAGPGFWSSRSLDIASRVSRTTRRLLISSMTLVKAHGASAIADL